MRKDKFQSAGRIAETMAHDAPPDPRAEMRPLTKAEVREREFLEVRGRREFGRRVAEDRIILALARMLWPEDYGQPSSFDALILCQMDDDDVDSYTGQQAHYDRLIRWRDNLRAKLA